MVYITRYCLHDNMRCDKNMSNDLNISNFVGTSVVFIATKFSQKFKEF
jgi:hypothetical protein